MFFSGAKTGRGASEPSMGDGALKSMGIRRMGQGKLLILGVCGHHGVCRCLREAGENIMCS